MSDEFMPEELSPLPEPVFKAILVTDAGPTRIHYIKLLHEIGNMDLTAAKLLADRPTPYVLAACDEDSAVALRGLLEAAGVKCELRDYEEEMEPAIPNDQPLKLAGTGIGGCATTSILLLSITIGTGYLIAWATQCL